VSQSRDSRASLRRVRNRALAAARSEAPIALRPLYDYDRKHGGDLVRTLQVYLTLGCNASRTSEELYLHRSGLLYRLRRIEELLDARLDDFEDRVALEVAALAIQSGKEQDSGEPPSGSALAE
jgi:DNA-binding PucR family transcriptional regulator